MELTITEKNRVINHPSIQILKKLNDDFKHNPIQVVGGAVVDLLEGKDPRDIDIIMYHTTPQYMNLLVKFGFVYLYDSSTSTTLSFGGYTFQILKKSLQDFDFEISKSTYNVNNDTFNVDLISFRNKTLIPNFEQSSGLLFNALSRIPHWYKKGYSINSITYQSILNKLSSKLQQNS